MTPETLQDAITLLPEDLLAPVDRLRQKKRIAWKPITAVVACLCLVVGLWFLNPGSKVAMDSANGSVMPECEPMENSQHSTSNVGSDAGLDAGIVAKVVAVGEDYLQVSMPLPDKFADKGASIQLTSARLTFENLQQAPSVQAGQTIRIYFNPEQFDENEMQIQPYKIETIKEDSQ